jgi:hypothetical protein
MRDFLLAAILAKRDKPHHGNEARVRNECIGAAIGLLDVERWSGVQRTSLRVARFTPRSRNLEGSFGK